MIVMPSYDRGLQITVVCGPITLFRARSSQAPLERLSAVLPEVVVPVQSVWSGDKRMIGTFLHSPMLDELKSLETILMQKVSR